MKSRRVLQDRVAGDLEKVDFLRREIFIKDGHLTRIVHSETPLDLPGIRIGDLNTILPREGGGLAVAKSIAPAQDSVCDAQK